MSSQQEIKSKEEAILLIKDFFDEIRGHINGHNTAISKLVAAVNYFETAQEARVEAIGFVTWIEENKWIRDPFPNKHTHEYMWGKVVSKDEAYPPEVTTEQLYNLYIESKK